MHPQERLGFEDLRSFTRPPNSGQNKIRVDNYSWEETKSREVRILKIPFVYLAVYFLVTGLDRVGT